MDYLEGRSDLRGAEKEWKLILQAEEIQHCVKKCAEVINTKFAGQNIVLTCILKGAVYFFVDLSRLITIPYSCYFIEATSYHDKQTQAEKISILSSINKSKFVGKTVILIDELFDNGTTITAIKHAIHEQAEVPLAAIFTTTLFLKDKTTKFDEPNLYGVRVPDIWLVGYGLDDKQEKRGWVHFFGCPKSKGIPPTKDDIIFSDEEAYLALRKHLIHNTYE